MQCFDAQNQPTIPTPFQSAHGSLTATIEESTSRCHHTCGQLMYHRPVRWRYAIEDLIQVNPNPNLGGSARFSRFALADCLLWHWKMPNTICVDTHPFYAQRTFNVQHGLNRNARPFAAFSTPHYRTSSPTPRHHGPPAVATREHAPQVWSQATCQSTISTAVWCWEDLDRDKSE